MDISNSQVFTSEESGGLHSLVEDLEYLKSLSSCGLHHFLVDDSETEVREDEGHERGEKLGGVSIQVLVNQCGLIVS